MLRRKAKVDIDYKLFHTHGKKVPKDRSSTPTPISISTAMGDSESLKTLELQISEDVESILESEPDLLSWDLEDLNDKISEMNSALKEFRHIHAELKNSVDVDHPTLYPKYKDKCLACNTFVKKCKDRCKVLRSDAEKASREDLRSTLIIEVSVLKERITGEIAGLDIESADVSELKDGRIRCESLLSEYYQFLGRAKIALRNIVDAGLQDIFDETLKLISDRISELRTQVKSVETNLAKTESDEKARLASESRQRLVDEHKFQASTISDEIEAICTDVKQKCDINSLSKMSDQEIFDASKNMVYIDSDMRNIFDKITGLSKVVSVCGSAKDALLKAPLQNKKEALEARNKYMKHLYSIVQSRGVTEEKLKNASVLDVPIPSFSGYDSKLDIYTFRSEFQKFVQPNVLSRYWVDTLKKKYLSGPAFTLVDKIEDIDEVWSKLVGAYGNVKLLLQNKISKLEKIQKLEKLEGDEKIGNALTKVVNTMTELSDLAEKFNLECKLYFGGGLEKVFEVIGETRERKFLKGRVQRSLISLSGKRSGQTTTGGVESEVAVEKETWDDLKKFLQTEISLHETMASVYKSKECLGIKSKGAKNDGGKSSHFGNQVSPISLPCHICGLCDHVLSSDMSGRKHVDYFSCPTFVKLPPKDRLLELKSRGLCLQCLSPGQKHNEQHVCHDKYVCTEKSDKYHQRYSKSLHFLVCERHKDAKRNLELLEEYKKFFIAKRSKDAHGFSKNISLVCCQNLALMAGKNVVIDDDTIPDVQDLAIFALQTINFFHQNEDIDVNIFYDGGCSDAVISKYIADLLASVGLAWNEIPGPLKLIGVGNYVLDCPHGIWTIKLPLKNGRFCTISGICLDEVTKPLPICKLGKVEQDVRTQFEAEGGASVGALPRLPKQVGGRTDLLLGSQYLRYHPRLVWANEDGLSLYDSRFTSKGGTTGVIAGPHPDFTAMLGGHGANMSAYFSSTLVMLRQRFMLSSNISLLGEQGGSEDVIDDSVQRQESRIGSEQIGLSRSFCSQKDTSSLPPDNWHRFEQIEQAGSVHFSSCEDCRVCYRHALASKRPPKNLSRFEQLEETGTVISFRCDDCRACSKCKKSQRVEMMSIQEEVEQNLIEKCVNVDISQGRTTHELPFIADPDSRLAPNEHIARRIYQSQIKTLNNRPEDKASVIASEGKLQELGFVDYFSNLPPETRQLIADAPLQHFLPWRIAWNPDSLSTPSRMVFDGTFSGLNGCGLNSVLAKGTNNMNSLVIMLIAWVTCRFAFHTDIAKMYNHIWLDEKHWRYQLYLWDEELSLGVPPVWKVIKTAIYGVISSGNVADCGLRKTAELTKMQYPKAYPIIMDKRYVDDVFAGDNTEEDREESMDQLSSAMAKGGFSLKGFTVSHEDPPEKLSSDGKSVNVGGLRWFSKTDEVLLKVPELDFSKKRRGRKAGIEMGVVPQKLTRRDCVSKVAEVFDPLGWVTPVTSGLKIDMHQLSVRKLDWDDEIPSDLRAIWESNFQKIQDIREIRFQRSKVPPDAVNNDVQLIGFGDASQKMICVAVYVRYKRKNGEYSCKLLFARSKVVPEDMSLPRAELLALTMNASTVHTAKIGLGDRVQEVWLISDSVVALHWATCTKLRLKLWVRNQVVEINRLVDSSRLFHIESKKNAADVGTRGGVSIVDVCPGSEWIDGQDWMRGDGTDFPIRTAQEIILDNVAKDEARKEKIQIGVDAATCSHMDPPSQNCPMYLPTRYVPDEVGLRYEHSKYIIDPNQFRFRKVVRILALVFLFLKNISRKVYQKRKIHKTPKFAADVSTLELPYMFETHDDTIVTSDLHVTLNTYYIKLALHYFFKKATDEVKHFLPKHKFKNISEEVNDILYFTGRILPTQKVTGAESLCDTSFDLAARSFCVPMVERLSPVAYAVANDVHWYDPDVKHGGVESLLRHTQCISYILGGRKLVKDIKRACVRCRLLAKLALRVAMGPKSDDNLCVAPAFYTTQVDLCGPFDSFSNANKRATMKVWMAVFCCCVTGAVDCKIMDDYSTIAFVFAFVRFSCQRGYPWKLLPDYGSQLLKACRDSTLSFTDIRQELCTEYGVKFETCPVGAHHVHGKVERKIQHVKNCISKEMVGQRLSLMQWETLAHQVSNTINNLPIGLANKTDGLENLDILTPNRLLLGRNNSRSPANPLLISGDPKKIVETNNKIFRTWFKSWLVSYVPTLVQQPKWFVTDRMITEGDVVLFLKSEKEFQMVYQYGVVKSVKQSRDGLVRSVEVEYNNVDEGTKRTTERHPKNLVVIHPVDEIGLSKELTELYHSHLVTHCEL